MTRIRLPAVSGGRQGSDEWLRDRMGRITGTRAGTVLSWRPASVNRLLDEIEAELADPDAAIERIRAGFDGGNLAFGRENEPVLLARYELARGVDVERPGLLVHPEIPYLAASPDFLLDDRVGEGKCRISHDRHFRTISTGAPDPEYVPQIQAEILVSGKPRADFVSFCPDYPDVERRLVIVEVDPDPEILDRLVERAREFWRLLEAGERLPAEAPFTSSGSVPAFF